MKARRGQLLSLDAMLSLIVMIFVFAAVLNTSAALKGEITSMLGWYERANIAENMLDVLTKSPGEPEDWENDPGSVETVGLRSSDKIYALNYRKLMALNSSVTELAGKLANLSNDKDFMVETFVSRYNVGIEGRFPRVYIDNVTFSNPKGNPPGINFEISSGNGNNPFTVSYVEIIRGGSSYINEDICSLKTGNNIVLQDGDRVKFILAEDVTLTATRGQYTETYTIPSGALVDIYITGPEVSNFQINFGGGSCPYTFKFSGKGNVVVTVFAADSGVPKLTGNYTSAPVFESLGEPTYVFAVINRTVIADQSVINASMNRSPWVEVERRIVTVERFEYNLSAPPSQSIPMIYGALRNSPPAGAYLKVSVPDVPGNVSFVVISGAAERGLMVYKEASGEDVKAVLVYDNKTAYYSGNVTSVSIPLNKILGDPKIGDTVGVWLYSLNGWDRSSVGIELVPDLKWALGPKLDAAIIKLWVWDDS
ncbi:hypothetical protein A3L09_08580 [Thermococcus profundus]|uniref:Uncharacterized protein n=1 Tax=Thermococcus profundus TaxID=49899 RepID=A0A2Z2MAA6_THEPR|nr:hypothetical protein [Thermococcus profundus]ASJ03307.1 hypothetical protein A3L09_08580 [Thermococcus profundus]